MVRNKAVIGAAFSICSLKRARDAETPGHRARAYILVFRWKSKLSDSYID